MTTCPLAIPLLQAAAWFGADPLDPCLPAGSDGLLDLAWGEPSVAFVEPLQRRRLSRLARGFFHCANRLDPSGQARLVFASRHGEADRTLAILQDLAAGAEVSPTLFSMSVHNAIPGLWSIQKGSRAPASAVAAGAETFAWGLVEAVAALSAEPSAPVLYVYGDDRLPDPWAGPVPRGLLHVVALLLGEPAGQRLTLLRDPARSGPETLPLSVHFLRGLVQRRAGTGSGPQPAWLGPDGAWSWQFP